MKRWPLAAALVAAALVLGATVFAEPTAWAAQIVSATITGPLDEQGKSERLAPVLMRPSSLRGANTIDGI